MDIESIGDMPREIAETVGHAQIVTMAGGGGGGGGGLPCPVARYGLRSLLLWISQSGWGERELSII